MSLHDHGRESIKASPLFSALDEAAIEDIVSECATARYKAGERIFWPGGRADKCFLILSGRVKVFLISPKGDEQILHLYETGQTFGEAAMLAGTRYPAFADALVETKLLAISRRAILERIASNADLAMAMLAGLSRKLQEFNRLIEQLSLKEVPARLATALLAEAARAGSDTFRLQQTKRQLAAHLGTVAETLSRALARLKTDGLIGMRGGEITILDRKGLAEVAHGA